MCKSAYSSSENGQVNCTTCSKPSLTASLELEKVQSCFFKAVHHAVVEKY
jgi:hypothetical protein